MKLKKDFKLRQICGENIITAEGMQAIDFSKLVSLNETALPMERSREARRVYYRITGGSTMQGI